MPWDCLSLRSNKCPQIVLRPSLKHNSSSPSPGVPIQQTPAFCLFCCSQAKNHDPALVNVCLQLIFEGLANSNCWVINVILF